MGRPDFRQPIALPVPYHLHDHGDAVDGDVAEGLQHGLPYELEPEPEPAELKSADPLRFHYRVPLP